MILNICTKAIKHISESLRRFIVVFAYTIVMFISYIVIDCGGDMIDTDLMGNIIGGCIIGAFAAIIIRLIEERRHPDHPKQIAIAGISLIPTIFSISILQYGVLTDRRPITVSISVGIAIILLCIIMYILASAKHEGYIYAWAIKSIAFSGFVAQIIGIGISICISAIDSLLIDVDYSWAEYLWVFIGFVIFTNLLCSYIPKADDELHISQFFKVIVAYVLLPIFLLLTLVLYLYILKIIFTLHMPSGTMNWFASLALAAWAFFWLTLRYIDNKLIQLYVRWGWILLIPIVIVQMIGVVIRLQAYGLTTIRYASLVCTLLGVIALIVAALNKRPKIMMVVVAITTGIITITPLNVIDVPNMDQYHRLVTLMKAYGKYDPEIGLIEEDETIIPKEDAEKIYSSYKYFSYYNREVGYIDFDIDKEIFQMDRDMSTDELYTMLNMEDDTYGLYTQDNYDHYRDTHLTNPDEYVNTTGTTKMRYVYIDFDDGDYNYHKEFSDGTVVDADFSQYAQELNEYIKYPTDGDDSEYVEGELSDQLSRIEVSGGWIWIKDVSVNGYEVTDTPSFYITGYYLEY